MVQKHAFPKTKKRDKINFRQDGARPYFRNLLRQQVSTPVTGTAIPGTKMRVSRTWVEGKQTHTLHNSNTLPTQEMRQRATKYCHWEKTSVVWTMCATLSAVPSIPCLLHVTDFGSTDSPRLPQMGKGGPTSTYLPCGVTHRTKCIPGSDVTESVIRLTTAAGIQDNTAPHMNS